MEFKKKMEKNTVPEIEYILPSEIEKRSFEIISEELSEMGISLPSEELPITKRVIHTTADFSYAKTLSYSENAVATAMSVLEQGATVVTDTNMALSGINKGALKRLGCSACCFMADENVATEAKERGVTRATVSMERAEKIEGPVIYAIGNAPTALIALHERIERGGRRPDFLIGVPVGFVNVEASKELFRGSGVPYIINFGRKGGSNVAAAIVNALMYLCGARS